MVTVCTCLKDESGASAVEYGLIVSLVAVALIACLTLLGTQLSNTFNKIAGNLAAATR